MQKRAPKNTQKVAENAEPIGIVISRGSRLEETPRFAAYVWGPVPDGEITEDLIAVA